MRRIHIVGGPGSGKTTQARRLALAVGAAHIDLDDQAIRIIADLPEPLDFELLRRLREEELEAIAAGPAWVTEGAFLGVTQAFLQRADLIVWMQVPWRVASYRIVTRHIKATVRRNNRFPGWGNLYRFWRWCGRYYANKNAWGYNDYDTPATEAFLAEELRKYSQKLFVCRGERDIALLLERAKAGAVERA